MGRLQMLIESGRLGGSCIRHQIKALQYGT